MNHPNQTDLERIRQTERRRALVRKALTYTALVLWALMVLFPFYWMLLTSVKSYGSYNAEHIPALFTLSPTLENYKAAFTAVPLGRYLLNTLVFTVLTTAIMAAVSILAAYAFARYDFKGKGIAFALILMQLMIMPDVLVVENYSPMSKIGVLDSTLAISLPYMASAFGIFLLRQTFKSVPKELEEAAAVEGANTLQVLWHVYVPLAKPTYAAYALVSISTHWNNFLWPLIVTNSVNSRPLTVGLQIFSATEQGVDWTIITAATLMTSGPLLVAFLLFQRQFVQSFMRAGIK